MKNLITFEGCEGVGKSTQVRLLKEYCTNKDIDALFTREPGGSIIAEKIRNIILDKDNFGMSGICEAFLYSAARNQHINEIIIPALNEGKLVICDRYFDSTYAYQGVARGLGVDFIDRLNELTVGEYKPEYTVFLDLNPTEAFKRKGGADTSDRLEIENIDFHYKVYEGYMDAASRWSDRFIIVDASGSKTETHEKVIEALRSKGIIE